MAHVVTVFLRNRGEVLLTRRSDDVGTYAGRWAGVSGYVEGDPADAREDALREVCEETGVADASPVRAGDPLRVVDGDREWTVHPFLFDAPTRDVETNDELAAVEWASPTAMLERETVPGLWEVYRRVAPTVASVRDDDEHGSAYVSVRALEVLRDCAAVADDWDEVAAVARDLRGARPGMAALRNRVDRVVAQAERRPDAVHDEAIAAIARAVDADDAAAANAAELLDGTVLTLSRSGTVLAALLAARPDVVVAESRPAREGVVVAEHLADAGLDVTLTTDAAVAHVLAEHDVDAVLVGADAVFPDGVVNKAGTRAAALAAASESVPFYVVAARDKVEPRHECWQEPGDPAAVYDGDAGVSVENPLFDVTPVELLDGVVTEDGVLDPADLAATASEHRALAAWDDD